MDNNNPSKQLFDAECGQPNAVVRLGRHIFRDTSNNTANQQRFGKPGQSSRPEDAFAQEYLAQLGGRHAVAPTTFSMRELLHELEPPNQSHNWSREFLATARPGMPDSSGWGAEFLNQQSAAQQLRLEQAWQNAHSATAGPHAGLDLKWSTEYLSEAESATAMPTSESMLNNVPNDAELWKTEFMQFMDKLDRGELKIEGDTVTSSSANVDTVADGWSEMETAWKSSAGATESHPWLAEYDDGYLSMYKNYEFAEDNPYMDVEDSLEIGKRMLAEGNLRDAVLYFESAVQRHSDSSEAWLYLGRAQAENEQEGRAIAALEKCLQLDQNNLEALVTLSTAYANESLYDTSCKTLARWLRANPKYSAVAGGLTEFTNQPATTSFLDRETFNMVEGAFLQAAQLNSTVDPDLQNAVGVLYNLTGDVNRAIDCFRAALMLKPDEARLWNRMGATMANGGRSAEAVNAYAKALQLYPGFVRARYNLGVSCLNLGSHREAIDHFLSALTLQQTGVGPTSQSYMSDGIWNTLRVAISHLHRDDLFALVDNRDINGLKRTFGNTVTAPEASA